jgi:phycobilisome core-membrane linker protein
LQLPAIYALAAEGAQRFVMRPGLSGSEKAEIIRAAQRQVFERDIAKAYSQEPCSVEASQVRQGQISMREFIRALGKSKEYRTQFFGRFSNSRAVELAFRHFLGRGPSSLEEFRKYFAIVSAQGLGGLVDSLINSMEYARVFGEETVPYLRDLGEEAQESAGWGSNRKLFQFSAPFEGAPQYVTLYAAYRQPLADQHVYGGGNDPIGLQYGAIFPSATASVATRPAPHGYRTRRLLVGNGMESPGQMDSPGFRSSQPRRVGPKVVRLQQIATGGSSKPKRGGLANIRNTESSTQAVINAVYVQILGNSGYAGDRISSEENKLENGNISLREFIRMVARSKAFRRRYWSGLYITKAIEVMHRRLLGRPSFGRWEINSYFDIAARKGFYGVVDALINSKEYIEAFGEDTVPYERFITANDLNGRRVPALRMPLDFASIKEPQKSFSQQKRPDIYSSSLMNTPGSITPRNFPGQSNANAGLWRADVGGQIVEAEPRWIQSQNNSIRQLPSPNRGWSAPRWQSDSSQSGKGVQAKGLKQALGLQSENAASKVFSLSKGASVAEKEELICAVYRQLLNRIPFASERLIEAESKFCNGQIDVAKFVAQVAANDLFQQRLWLMTPMAAASAAHMALLGRAPEAAEATAFLSGRAQMGQVKAIEAVLNSASYKTSFGANTVPYLKGLGSQPGMALSSLVRTATLYGGNGGLTPAIQPN